jgi:hypothetical protein
MDSSTGKRLQSPVTREVGGGAQENQRGEGIGRLCTKALEKVGLDLSARVRRDGGGAGFDSEDDMRRRGRGEGSVNQKSTQPAGAGGVGRVAAVPCYRTWRKGRARGSAWWAIVVGRSKMNSALFYLFKIFSTNSNFKWFKEYLPVVESFQIKYGFAHN